MKVYISGPITGTTDYMNRFEWAAACWRDKGCEVIDPAKVNSFLPENTTHEEYMKMSITMLSMCDTIYILRGWRESKGALEELEYAKAHDLNIIYEGKCPELFGMRTEL